MTLGDRLKTLRRELGLSQEALGAQGFVSAPGWIKIENGQRQASEKLIEKLVKWLVGDKYMKAGAASTLREELLTLKYLGARSVFVREMAKKHAKTCPTPPRCSPPRNPARTRPSPSGAVRSRARRWFLPHQAASATRAGSPQPARLSVYTLAFGVGDQQKDGLATES